MSDASLSRRVHPLRVRAVVATRIRRIVRTRIALAAAVFALLPWAIVDAPPLVARLSSLAQFSVVGLTVLAAGAISDDLDSGEFAIALSHHVSPLEILIGNAIASLLPAALLVGAQLPFALRGVAIPRASSLVLCLVALVALLAGWLALMLLFATFLQGKGNAIAMILVLVLPVVLRVGVLTRLPASLGSLAEHALRLLPQVDEATTLFRALLYRSPLPLLEVTVLVTTPFLYFALAAYRLYRLEPAGRLTQ